MTIRKFGATVARGPRNRPLDFVVNPDQVTFRLGLGRVIGGPSSGPRR